MTAPYITVAGTSYALESLSDRARMLSSDLLRTIQEYRAMLTSYRETLALTGAYTGGLKDAVQKADLPIALNTDNNPETPIIKIGDVSYEAGDLPDSVKASVSALVRANTQKTGLEFRLRQLDASRVAFVKAIQDEITATHPAPMNPQPVPSDNS